jgi:hypothetical protein
VLYCVVLLVGVGSKKRQILTLWRRSHVKPEGGEQKIERW